MPASRMHHQHRASPNSEMSFRLATAGMYRPAFTARGENAEETGDQADVSAPARIETEGTRESYYEGQTANVRERVPAAIVDDPNKRYIRNSKHHRTIVRWIIALIGLIKRPFIWWKEYNSEDARLNRARVRQIKGDMRDAEKRLKSCAMGLGFKAMQKFGKYSRYGTIDFDVESWEEPNGDRLYYHVASPLPDGVWGADLVKQDVLNEFQRSVQHPMSGYDSPHTGTLLIIERAGQSGLPRYVALKTMLDDMPKSAPPLAFPAGVAYNGRPVFMDLAEGPHALIAGGSRKGKSNMQNAIITTWALRNTPNDVRLVLFDIKRGVEFGRYKGLKLLMDEEELGGSPIIEVVEEIIPCLTVLKGIMDKRLDMLKHSHVTNLGEYNLKHRGKNRLPFIVLIFDEWAVARLDDKDGKDIEHMVQVLANQGAAAGFHIIIGTQYPKATILDGLVTINFQMRLAFSLTQHASLSFLGNTEAFKLEVPGRMVAVVHDETYRLQAPRVTNSTIEAVVHASRTGGSVEEMARLDSEEICIWALDNLGGDLTFDILFSHYRESGITQPGLKSILKSMDNQIFILRDTPYKVIPGSGTRARRLEQVQE